MIKRHVSTARVQCRGGIQVIRNQSSKINRVEEMWVALLCKREGKKRKLARKTWRVGGVRGSGSIEGD